MKAVGKYLVLKKEKREKSSGSSFITPDNNRYVRASVFSKGDEILFVEEKQIVYYDKTQGHDIMVDGVEYRIVRGDAIVAVD